jgi:hypothetical protein
MLKIPAYNQIAAIYRSKGDMQGIVTCRREGSMDAILLFRRFLPWWAVFSAFT